MILKRNGSFVMPWGAYRGWKIENIPSPYLKYTVTYWDEDTDFMKKLVEECSKEYEFRERYNCHIYKD